MVSLSSYPIDSPGLKGSTFLHLAGESELPASRILRFGAFGKQNQGDLNTALPEPYGHMRAHEERLLPAVVLLH